jgi:perosamine synthetase
MAFGVSSGTAGLHCAMIAAGIGPGDEVLTTPFSFVASTNCSLLRRRRRPRFVDIDPRTLNLDPDKLEAAISHKTKAIVAVETVRPSRRHERGRTDRATSRAEPDRRLLRRLRRPRARTRDRLFSGRAGIFAFYPNKQITTGEGGMIVTDDDHFAALCRSLRNQGRDGMGWLAHARLGYNYRLSEINAALGVAQVGPARRDPRQPPAASRTTTSAG